MADIKSRILKHFAFADNVRIAALGHSVILLYTEGYEIMIFHISIYWEPMILK